MALQYGFTSETRRTVGARIACFARNMLRMCGHMFLKNIAECSFICAFGTFVYFASHCLYEVWMFSNHVII
ncbi:unnamed protein product [Callosobruchus maculatus]|uniref:Uncharacterized protein n=1 Tax=Callosobruchus maculatus TaxID=64391 RepID=A0A653CZH2_CALMS|nr:unnamed protein product [Callosobruchus maculatus]